MRFCSNCGAENDTDAKFCASCGTILEAAPAEPAAAENPVNAPAPEAFTAAAATPGTEAAPQPQMYADPAPQQQPYAAPQGQPYQTNYVPYQETAVTTSAKCRTFGIIGFILGIVSTAFSWICFLSIPGLIVGFLFLACGIVGLVFCNISIRNGQFTLARVGKVFSIIGIVLCSILWVIALIIIIAALSTAATMPFYY